MERMNENTVPAQETFPGAVTDTAPDVTGFEDAFGRLNGILSKMDEPGVSLEESGILHDRSDLLAKGRKVEGIDVPAVVSDGTLLGLLETKQEP